MKLIEMCCAVHSSRVSIFIEGEKGFHEFVSTGWGENTYSAIRKACEEFGDKIVTCIYPLARSELTITVKKAG